MARPPKNVAEDELFEGITFTKPEIIEEEDLEAEDVPSDKPRERRASTRTQSTRVSKERPALDFTIGTRFNIPTEITEGDPDHQYGFIPYMANGEQLQDVVDDAVERGWWPVLKSEHPLLARRYLTDLYGSNKTDRDNYIIKGGQIVMKRLRSIHDAEQDKFKELDKRNETFRKSMVLFDESKRGPLRNF